MRNNVVKHEIMAGLCNLALGWSSPAGISIPLGPAFKTHIYTHTDTSKCALKAIHKKNKYNEIINEPYSTYLHKAFSIYSFLLGKHCSHLSLCLSSDRLDRHFQPSLFFPPSLLERRARHRSHLPVFVSMARGGVTGDACWRTWRKAA